DSELPRLVSLVSVLVGGWRALDLSAREKLIVFIRTSPGHELAPRLKHLGAIDDLRAELEARVAQFSVDELAISVGASQLVDAIRQRPLQLLSEVRSWGAANAVLTKTVFPIFESLSPADVRT